MTLEQFKNNTFSANTRVEYDNGIYDVISVDFEEMLIGLEMFPDEENDSDKIRWVRCENCEIEILKANNGWIKIIDEESFPLKDNTPCAFYDKKYGILFGTFNWSNIQGIINDATHYQPIHIENLKPPKY